jgi:nucleoid-associated protein YgaU
MMNRDAKVAVVIILLLVVVLVVVWHQAASDGEGVAPIVEEQEIPPATVGGDAAATGGSGGASADAASSRTVDVASTTGTGATDMASTGTGGSTSSNTTDHGGESTLFPWNGGRTARESEPGTAPEPNTDEGRFIEVARGPDPFTAPTAGREEVIIEPAPRHQPAEPAPPSLGEPPLAGGRTTGYEPAGGREPVEEPETRPVNTESVGRDPGFRATPSEPTPRPDLAAGPAADTGATWTYTVKPGDVGVSIAREQLGSSRRWAEVARLNNIAPDALLQINQKLKMPPKNAAPSAPASLGHSTTRPVPAGARAYTVKPGDVGSEIAREQLGSVRHWPAIAKYNNIAPDAVLQVDQRLLIPQRDGLSAAPAPTARAAATEPPAPRLADIRVPAGTRRYLVRKGDVLSKVARKELGDWRRWREIAELNLLGEDDTIYAGETILIPAR